jgi:ribose/xylose/arabinose/galactoside ABC-type transport system permease subunit
MSTQIEVQKPRAPWHLWVVGGLALVWNAIGAMDYVMTQTRNEAYMAQFTPEQLEYFYGFPAWVVAAWAIAVWGGLLGAILLLLRRRLAVPVFLVSFIAMVITTIYNYLLSDGMRVMGDAATLAFTGAIFFIALLLWLYARAMAQRGVLG